MPSKNFSKNLFLHIVFFTHHHYSIRIDSDIATVHMRVAIQGHLGFGMHDQILGSGGMHPCDCKIGA